MSAVRDFVRTPIYSNERAALDPLGADGSIQLLREMNAVGDVTGLVTTLARLAPSTEQIARFSPSECAAALRDLGIFLGSIKRHGAEPVSLAPQLEQPLLLLAGRTDTVPRDTFSHYGPWNPTGVRQRMYTGDAREGFLIESLRVAVPAVEAAVAILDEMLDLEPGDAAFASLGQQVAQHLDSMVRAVDLVRQNVTPEFFARSVRPYFEPVTIAGRAYLGPAAAHMPLFLVDRLLWSSDCEDASYLGFQQETVSYSLPRWRVLFHQRAGQPSVTTRILAALRAAPAEPGESLRASTEALCEIFRTLIIFRGRHLALVRGAYREDTRLYAVGSGGASMELVAHILRLTRGYAAVLASNQACPGSHHA
jgi:hypothetical protein